MLKRRKNNMAPASEDCPLVNCMRFMAGAWTANILWSLKSNSRRFSELRDDIPSISAKVLTQRLRRMEKNRLVLRTIVKTTSPPSVEYSLTDLGKELNPVIEAIVRVGEKLKVRQRALGTK